MRSLNCVSWYHKWGGELTVNSIQWRYASKSPYLGGSLKPEYDPKPTITLIETVNNITKATVQDFEV